MTKGEEAGHRPECIVTPLPFVGGERRSYRGLAQPFVAHSHGYYVVGCVRKGRRTLSLNGRDLPIGPDDLIVFNPGDVHGCVREDESLFAYDSFTIAEGVVGGVRLKTPDSKDAREAARSVFDEALFLLDDSRFEEVFERVLFLASMLEVDEAKNRSLPAESVAARIYAHLCGHLADPSSVAALAAAENISEYALIRAYRKRFAITPLQHLMALRVDCACELLAQGVAPSAVAAETGFSDQAHLTRVFKQRIGTTPAAYARMASQRA